MAAEYFNSLGGFSAGLPEVPVIDANGNVITNVLTNGNVFANVVYATYYKFANGQPFNGVPAGSSTQLQYNNNGSFAGIPNVTFNGSNLSLGNVANIKITGGLNGYFLQTDGEGNLTWAAGGGGGGNGTPGGANTQVQFNDSGSFGGDAGFVYDKNTNILTVSNLNVVDSFTGNISFASTAGTVTTNAQPNITSVGTLTSLNVTNTIAANLFAGSGANLTNLPAANLVGSVPLAQAVTNAAQPNITSVGVLTSLTSSGNIAASGTLSGGNVSVSGTVSTTNLSILGNATFANTFTANANSIVNFAVASDVNLGTLANITIIGGDNGYVLSTDGAGNLSWIEGSGGNGTPGGSNTQIQYNDVGTFGGSPFFTFNDATNTVQVAGNMIANTMQLGAGTFKFCTSQVHSAITVNTSPNQLLYSIPAEGVSGADFHIIATDTVSGTRQSSKISSVIYGNELQYNEYAGMYINGGVGSFSVSYNPGNVVTEPSLELKISPDSTNQTVYKMLITVFDD
jgi:hypothetical protein